MTFFSAILVKVLIGLFSALSGWLVRHFQEIIKDRKEAASDEKKMADAILALQNAKTKQELEDAAKNIANNL